MSKSTEKFTFGIDEDMIEMHDWVQEAYDEMDANYLEVTIGVRKIDHDENGNEVWLTNLKDVSDGYHTFEELYYHRMMLFATICHTYKDKAWKSMLHADGTMYSNSFIVGVETPEGQYTYHYNKEFYDVFNVKELDRAPAYDGHQPKDIVRLDSLLKGD